MVNKATTKKAMRQFTPKRTALGKMGGQPLELPNLSKGKAPESDKDLANKKYVDDSFPVTHASTTGQTANDHHAQSHNVASHSDTSATGAELNTLTDNSVANTLHRHSELVASDGAPDPVLSVDAIGQVGIGTTSPVSILEIKEAKNNANFTINVDEGGYVADDVLGKISFRNHDSSAGVNEQENAYIRFIAKSTISGGVGDNWQLEFGVSQEADLATTTHMVIDEEGRVGIGTDTPDSTLDLKSGGIITIPGGGGANAITKIRLLDNTNDYSIGLGPTSTEGYIQYHAGTAEAALHGHKFFVNGVEKMRIRGDGNVGIGVTDPDNKLEIKGAGLTSQSFLKITDSGDVNQFVVLSDASGDAEAGVYNTAGARKVKLAGNGDSWFMGGNVGIGTTSPSEKLVVSGTDNTAGGEISAKIWNKAANQSVFGVGSSLKFVSYSGDIVTGKIANYHNAAGEYDLRFFTYGTSALQERVRIDKAGNVGIGTTSPSEKLDINSDAIRIRTAQTPASAGAAGTAGMICWDASFIYVCTATNTWKRTAIATW